AYPCPLIFNERTGRDKPCPYNSGIENMLTHIVIWKYRADVEQAVRDEHVARLRRLASIIHEIESFNVGFDVLGLPRSYDTGLVATFRDRAALEAYTVHPEHILVADMGRNISSSVASVDFVDEE
nr:Dabb family protein [Acidobacteriota bacterium]